MTHETGIDHAVHAPHILDNDIDVPRKVGVLHIEVGLHPLDLYQKMFPQYLNLMEFYELVEFRRGLFDSDNYVYASNEEKSGQKC